MTRTICLKGDYVQKEAIASSAITPGMLVEFGGAKELQAHATAGGPARKAFALENDLVGEGIDDAYALNDQVRYAVFQRGAEVYALLANGQNVAKGDRLVSNGAGSLAKESTEPQQDSTVAWALEAVNNSSGSPARIRVEVA